MADEDPRIEKLARLVEGARASWVKTGEQLDELEALLASAPSIGQLVRRAMASWADKWKRAYRGEPYVFARPKDPATIARMVRQLSGDVDELERRFDRYLAAHDPFYAQKRHPLGLFASTVNQWGSSAGSGPGGPLLVDEDAGPVDCRHVPRCKSDRDHTRRKMADVRAPRPATAV